MGLFKTGNEMFDTGHSQIKQGEFSKAISTFEKANQKLQKQGDGQTAQVAYVLAQVLKTHINSNNPGAYTSAVDALNTLGNQELKFGVRNANSTDIAKECTLKTEELNAIQIPTYNIKDFESISFKEGSKKSEMVSTLERRAQQLKEVGMKYQTSIGNNVLILPEMFNKQKITGIQKAMELIAEAHENLGEAVVWSDPKKAAEYYQTAANYRNQAGEQNIADNNRDKVTQYKQAVKCWFCGREIYGKQIHYFEMPSHITDFQRNSKEDSPLPTKHTSEDIIFACRACHEAISLKADEIAEHYHQLAMEHTERVRSGLQSQIDQLHNAIRSIRR